MVRVHLGLSRVLKMIILAFLGHPWTSFLGLGVALGVHFGGMGVALGVFGAQSSPKAASLFHGPPFLSDFGAQMVPRRLPKWT